METDEELAQDIVFSYSDWQANTFAVDCNGTRAVLAVQKWLAVVSLEHKEKFSEPKAIRKLGRQNKYEIKAVLWNPHASQQDLLVSTCQQKLDIWNVNVERHPLLQSIKAHTRPVSDVSWSFTDYNLLGSCAIDSFVHIWDIRETRRPKLSFKAVAGASLVQWNRLNGNLIASAHDSDIRIWDMRKPSTASGYITAHMSRIHDLDWSYSNENQLTTCSHDASIKFWDTSSPREPMSSIKAGSQPLWRARNYPTGNAVAMVLVPAMHSGDSRVFLWGRSNVASPLHVFTGHSEPVLEVQWIRHKGGYNLATWSKDRTLRIWGISDQLKHNLGGQPTEQLVSSTELVYSSEQPSSGLSMSIEDSENEQSLDQSLVIGRNDPTQSLPIMKPLIEGQSPLANSGSPSTRSLMSLSQVEVQGSLTGSNSHSQVFQPVVAQTLAQEFSLLNLDNIPILEMERLEASQRSCTVKVEQGGHLVRVGITFPSHYPNGAAPSFIFDKSTTIDITYQHELKRTITDTALTYVKQNRPCLEPCLRRLAKTLESVLNRPEPPNKQPDLEMSFGHLDDEHIPFPRTCGGRYSASGLLVCFNSPPGLTYSEVEKTPRSVDKMNTYKACIRPIARGQSHRWSGHGFISSSIPKRVSSGGTLSHARGTGDKPTASLFATGTGDNPFTGPVLIYDSTALLPIDRNLAKAYRMSGYDVPELCSLNAMSAAQYGRMDLVQAWSTAALVAELGKSPPTNPDCGVPWPQHPFGRQLIQSLFDHFAKLHDVQMLAMLACVFQEHSLQIKLEPIQKSKPSQIQNAFSSSSTSATPSTTTHTSITTSYNSSYSSNSTTTGTALSKGARKIYQALSNNQLSMSIGSSSPPKKVPGSYSHSPSDRDRFGGSVGPGMSVSERQSSPISSSWHEVIVEGDMSSTPQHDNEDPVKDELDLHKSNCKLLDDMMMSQCDEYRRCYANILYSWKLLDQRAEVLKFQVKVTKEDSQKHQAGFVNVCRACGERLKGPSCTKSRCFAFTCSVCNLSVRGSSNFCMSCGHGGHARHMMDWFSNYSVCPTGCGCSCLEASGWT